MGIETALDVTPISTFSTFQSTNEGINAVINAVLITLTVANIISIISKLVYRTHKDRFQFSSFLRAYIFHNSDDPALLGHWLVQSCMGGKNPTRSKYRIHKRRLVAPISARIAILVATIASIAISFPTEKCLKGCNRGDFRPVLRHETFSEALPQRIRFGPVCTEVPMFSKLGSVRSRASYCSVPVNADAPSSILESAILVRYFNGTGILYTGVASQSDEGFTLRASESYVEWVDQSKSSYRSTLPGWSPEVHIKIVLDAIRSEVGECAQTSSNVEVTNEGYHMVRVGCNFNALKISGVADAYVRESLTWERSRTLSRRLFIDKRGRFNDLFICPVDITVQRPIVNMLPLIAVLIVLFTVNLAVGLTSTERGDVMEQTFGLVKEVLGHDCRLGAIEESVEVQGVEVAWKKNWVCSGGEAYHEGFLKGEGCDEISEFPIDAVVARCKFADGSGRREVVAERAKGV